MIFRPIFIISFQYYKILIFSFGDIPGAWPWRGRQNLDMDARQNALAQDR